MAPQGGSRVWNALSPALSEWIFEAVTSMGFLRMTPVQASTIPLFTGNKDVVVEAVTGSGKTLSFLIPVVERLLKLEEPIKKHHVGAIIISPTRELATQIHSVLLALLAFHPPSAAYLDSTGTAEHSNQIEIDASGCSSSALKVVPQLLLGGTTTPAQDLANFLTYSPNLLISTPGRLLELLSSPHVHCPQSSFEVLVMDEADRLLDLGFKEDLQKILQRLPKQRRTGLFSASVSEAVDQLVRVGLRNPVRISVKVRGASGVEEERKTPASLQMTYLATPATHKLPTLIRLLTNITPQPLKSIAYLSTCAAVDYFQHLLPSLIPHLTYSSPNHNNQKLTIIPLHGRHTAAIRTKNFTRFTAATSPTLLLTTDVAARGLDIPQVDLTVQLDPPSDPKTFLHRAGRAGRAGRKGLSVVFLAQGREADEYPRFLAVRKTPVEPLTGVDVAVSDAEAASCMNAMRRVVGADRGLHDKGQRAFASWVRSYSKHAAKGIFRVEELPWGDLADNWALLRMPRMPELKRASDGKGWDVLKRELEGRLEDAGMEVDWENFKYKDVEREKKRRREMMEAANGDVNQGNAYAGKGKQASNSWAATLAAKKEKEERRKKKKRKRTAEHDSKLTDAEKKEQQEVKDMVEEMRRRVASAKEEEFQGFD